MKCWADVSGNGGKLTMDTPFGQIRCEERYASGARKGSNSRWSVGSNRDRQGEEAPAGDGATPRNRHATMKHRILVTQPKGPPTPDNLGTASSRRLFAGSKDHQRTPSETEHACATTGRGRSGRSPAIEVARPQGCLPARCRGSCSLRGRYVYGWLVAWSWLTRTGMEYCCMCCVCGMRCAAVYCKPPEEETFEQGYKGDKYMGTGSEKMDKQPWRRR